MGLFQSRFFVDSFRSLLSGLGVPGRDKSVSLVPSNFDCLSQNQRDLEALYRSNWLAKKIVEIPAFDATRAWRAWNAQPDEIEKLENTERAFGIQQKVLDAMIKSRLYGGACIVLGVRGSPFNEELDLDTIKEGDLKFVHVVSKWMIAAGQRVRDITSPWFGEPSYYMRSNIPMIGPPGNVDPLETTTLGYSPGEALWIHPSRVVRMIGSEYPDLESAQDAWGDSVLQACYECLRDAGLVTQSLASMISDCKVDVLRIEGLTQSLSTEEGTNKLLTYLSNANVAKSTVNSLVLDKTIEWDRMQTKFEGLPEVLQAYMSQCAGAADIPATRLFGRSPEGMNATGDSDIRNYYDRLASDQKVRLTPLLNRLDEVIIRTTFGKRDPDIHYTWNPLWQASASEKADIAFKKAQAFQIDNNAGLIPPEALLTARVNQLIEDEVYPGLDAAMDEVDDEFADEHMEYLRRVPPSPEEMMEMAAKKAALKGGPPGAGGGGVPKALTKEPNKTPPTAGPGTKDSSSARKRNYRLHPRPSRYDDGEDFGHPFRGNQYVEGQSGGAGGSSEHTGSRAPAAVKAPTASQRGGGGFSGGGSSRKSGSGAERGAVRQGPASHLASNHASHSISAESLIHSVPGAGAAIHRAETDLARGTPTSSLTTKGGYRLASGGYTPERSRLHASILTKMFNSTSLKAARPPAGQAPSMTLLGGRGGSGKSWFTKTGVADASHAIYINPDDIQAHLPGYKGWNAALYHEEAADIASKADDMARALHVNVIHDATMRTPGASAKRVEDFKKAGYNVNGHYMYVPPETAAKRALERFARGGTEGRYVPPSYILNSKTNEQTFDDLKDKFDHWSVYENTGIEPKQVARGGNQDQPDHTVRGFTTKVDAAKFIEARNKSTRSSYLSPLAPEDLKDHTLLMNDDATAGAAISADGDLQNVFNNSTKAGEGSRVIYDAIEHGAKTLDCFDGFLPKYYKKFGFVETDRVKFDPQYAPKNWNYAENKTPDVVFMRLKGK